jgi:hypothetical protein
MLFPKYVLEDLSVGSGSIIGKVTLRSSLIEKTPKIDLNTSFDIT